jgi:hypothetical protein
MIQVYKEAFKALKALVNVYHTLFFIITALKSENYKKKKQTEIPFPK